MKILDGVLVRFDVMSALVGVVLCAISHAVELFRNRNRVIVTINIEERAFVVQNVSNSYIDSDMITAPITVKDDNGQTVPFTVLKDPNGESLSTPETFVFTPVLLNPNESLLIKPEYDLKSVVNNRDVHYILDSTLSMRVKGYNVQFRPNQHEVGKLRKVAGYFLLLPGFLLVAKAVPTYFSWYLIMMIGFSLFASTFIMVSAFGAIVTKALSGFERSRQVAGTVIGVNLITLNVAVRYLGGSLPTWWKEQTSSAVTFQNETQKQVIASVQSGPVVIAWVGIIASSLLLLTAVFSSIAYVFTRPKKVPRG